MSQYDFYDPTYIGSEPKTPEINGNLFYFQAFLIRLTAVHLIQDMKSFTKLIYVLFSKVYMLRSIYCYKIECVHNSQVNL